MAGGNLRCFSKVRCLSEASSDFWKTHLADFRQPRISTPPAESGDRQHTPHGLAFQGGRDRAIQDGGVLLWGCCFEEI